MSINIDSNDSATSSSNNSSSATDSGAGNSDFFSLLFQGFFLPPKDEGTGSQSTDQQQLPQLLTADVLVNGLNLGNPNAGISKNTAVSNAMVAAQAYLDEKKSNSNAVANGSDTSGTDGVQGSADDVGTEPGNNTEKDEIPDIQIIIDDDTGVVKYGTGKDSGKENGNAEGNGGNFLNNVSPEPELIEIGTESEVSGENTGLEHSVSEMSFSTSKKTDSGSAVFAALSALSLYPNEDNGQGDDAVALGKNAVSIIQGYSNAAAQDMELDNIVDSIQFDVSGETAEVSVEKSKLKAQLQAMEWKDVRLGFRNKEEAAQAKSGGFLDRDEFEQTLKNFRLAFANPSNAAQVTARNKLNRLVQEQDLLQVLKRYDETKAESTAAVDTASSPSEVPQASEGTSPVVGSTVHLQFFDVIQYLLDQQILTREGDPPLSELSFNWTSLFEVRRGGEGGEDDAETEADYQRRQTMQGRTIQFLYLLRLQRSSAKSFRVFDRKRDGSEYGMLQQRGKQTQLLASSDLVVDTGGSFTVRTGPLKYDVTETFFNLQQEVQALRQANVTLTQLVYRVFDFAATNQRAIGSIVAKMFEGDVAGSVDAFFQDLQVNLQDTTTFSAAIRAMREVPGAKRYLPRKDDLPFGTETEREQYLLHYLAGDQSSDLTMDREQIVQRAVDAAKEEVQLLDMIFGTQENVPTTVLDEFPPPTSVSPGLSHLLREGDLHLPRDAGEDGFQDVRREAAKLSRVLLTRKNFPFHQLSDIVQLLLLQMGGRGKSEVDVQEFLRTFFGRSENTLHSGGVLDVPLAGYRSWLEMASATVRTQFPKSETLSDLADIGHADYPSIPIFSTGLLSLEVKEEDPPDSFRLRVHTELDPGDQGIQKGYSEEGSGTIRSKDGYIFLHPKGYSARLTAYSVLEAARFLDTAMVIANEQETDGTGTGPLKFPGMDSVNGKRVIRAPGDGQLQEEDCFDLVLISFATAKKDVTRDENGELINDNSGAFLISDDGGTGIYGFCKATEIAGNSRLLSSIVLNSRRRAGGPLIDMESGEIRVLPTVATAIHEFLHATEFANGIVPSLVNAFFSEGVAVATEFLCFEPVLHQMAVLNGPRSGVETTEAAHQFVTQFFLGQPGSSWFDFGASGDAVRILWDADLQVLDLDPTGSPEAFAELTEPFNQPYHYFLLFLLISALATKDAPAVVSDTENREMVFILRLLAKVRHNLTATPTSGTAVTDALLEMTYGNNDEDGGEGVTEEPQWFSTGKNADDTGILWQDVLQGTATAVDSSGSETVQPGWDRVKKLKYLQHCAKCYLTELCFDVNSILSSGEAAGYVASFLRHLLTGDVNENLILSSIRAQLTNSTGSTQVFLSVHDSSEFAQNAGVFSFDTSVDFLVDGLASGQTYYVETVFDATSASTSPDNDTKK